MTYCSSPQAVAQRDSVWKTPAAPEDINHWSRTILLAQGQEAWVPVQRGHIYLFGKVSTVLGQPQMTRKPGSPAGNVQITIFVNVTWTLASQFKGHRSQMLGSSLHDNFSNCSTSSIKNVVKSLLQKLCGFVNTAINNNVQVLKERQT